MGKWKVGTIIGIIALVLSIPAGIVGYQQMSRPWPSKERVAELETKVAGLRYESVLAAFLRCEVMLSKDRNNRRLRQRCQKLQRLLRQMEDK